MHKGLVWEKGKSDTAIALPAPPLPRSMHLTLKTAKSMAANTLFLDGILSEWGNDITLLKHQTEGNSSWWFLPNFHFQSLQLSWTHSSHYQTIKKKTKQKCRI